MPALIAAEDPDALPVAAEVLRRGAAVVVPTDTVYGLAVLPSVPGSTARVFALKGRPLAAPLAVLVASVEQAGELVELPPPGSPLRAVLDALWPGPLTVVLPRRADVDVDLGGDRTTVGVRCPDHDFVRTLAAELGPLATTSANPHGEPTPATAVAAAADLADDIALVVDGGRCEGEASTVIDGTIPGFPILREGPITAAHLRTLGH